MYTEPGFDGHELTRFVGWEVSRFVARESATFVGVLKAVRSLPKPGRCHVVQLVVAHVIDFRWPSMNEPGRFRGELTVDEPLSAYTSLSRADDLVVIKTSTEALRSVTILRAPAGGRTWPVELWLYEPDRIVQLPAYDDMGNPDDVCVALGSCVSRTTRASANLVATPTTDGTGLMFEAVPPAEEGSITVPREPVMIGRQFALAGRRAVVAVAPTVLARTASGAAAARMTIGPMLPFERRRVVRLER